MKKNITPLFLFCSVLVWSCNNTGETNTDTDTARTSASGTTANTPANTAPLSQTDQDFVMKSASSGKMEVEAGNLAQQNASSQQVKDFASMMVRDHTAANQELMSFASGRNVTVSDSLMPEHRQHLDAMRKMQGKSFDQHYMKMMTEAHQKDVAEFERAAQTLNDADLKNWANKTLPTLKMHLDSAKALRGKM